jgi:hypothetical protein
MAFRVFYKVKFYQAVKIKYHLACKNEAGKLSYTLNLQRFFYNDNQDNNKLIFSRKINKFRVQQYFIKAF